MKSGKYPLTTYLLVLIEEGENQLEFYSASLLRQGMLYEEDIFVVGLLVTAIIIGITDSALGFIAFALGFFVGLALLIYAGAKYNR